MPKRPVKRAVRNPTKVKILKPVPFEFVLEQLAPLAPMTRPMFGCTAVYVGEKIVLVLRDKDGSVDDGVWLATTHEYHASLKKDFPSMRSISVLGKDPTGWQVLPSDSVDFEEAATRACSLILSEDPRIGKIPKSKSTRKTAKKTTKRKT